MVKDLVCGMELREQDAEAFSFYKGKKYYFCSRTCSKKFDETPERYIEFEERKEDESSPEEDESSSD